jgi:hypothetical protein
MNWKSALMTAAGLALASVTPALAASPEVEAYCFAQAEQVRPVLTQPEKEAYIAGCIADATATPGRKPKY